MTDAQYQMITGQLAQLISSQTDMGGDLSACYTMLNVLGYLALGCLVIAIIYGGVFSYFSGRSSNAGQ